MKIKKVDDKPMVIHTKQKAKIHSHEPKTAKIKGGNVYTTQRGPKTASDRASAMNGGKKNYRKATVHQEQVKEKGLSRFKQSIQCFYQDEGHKTSCGRKNRSTSCRGCHGAGRRR